MLKLISTVFLGICTFALSAASQFTEGSINWDSNSHVQIKNGTGGGTILHSNQNTLYTVRLNSNTSGKNISIGASLVNASGSSYYDIELAGIGNKLNQKITLQDEVFKVFKPSVETTFWIKVDGKQYQSNEFTYTVSGKDITYTHGETGISFTVNAYDPEKGPGPSGQPLPGVALTLLLGAGTAVVWKRRRKTT